MGHNGYYLLQIIVYMGLGMMWEKLTYRLPILNPNCLCLSIFQNFITEFCYYNHYVQESLHCYFHGCYCSLLGHKQLFIKFLVPQVPGLKHINCLSHKILWRSPYIGVQISMPCMVALTLTRYWRLNSCQFESPNGRPENFSQHSQWIQCSHEDGKPEFRCIKVSDVLCSDLSGSVIMKGGSQGKYVCRIIVNI